MLESFAFTKGHFLTGKTCIDAAIIQYLHGKNNTFSKNKLHILEILTCGTKGRLKNGSASLCHYQRNEFYIFEFVAACGPRQTHFHTEAQTDSRDWRNPLRQNLTVLPAPPKGGAGIEQSEMTERVSHPRAGTALLIRIKLQKLISLRRSHFKLFFCPKWSIMRQ